MVLKNIYNQQEDNHKGFLFTYTCYENQFLEKSSASSIWKEVPLIIMSLPTTKSVG